MKDLKARTTIQLYSTFQYFLQQRKWDINSVEEEREFWVGTMHILNLPDRSQVKFLDRGPFLRAFEHSMLTARQFQVLRKEEDGDKEVRGGLQWPNYPPAASGYKREHPLYQEAPTSYKDWLKTEDRNGEDELEKCNLKLQERLLKVIRTVGEPIIHEAPEEEKQLRPESPSDADSPKSLLQRLLEN